MAQLRTALPHTLARVSIARPKIAIALWTLLLALALSGAAELRVETSTESLLDRSAAEWRYYRDSVDTFGGDEIIVVALHGDVWSDGALLERVRTLTSDLESIDGVRRVDSLASVPLIRSSPDGSVSLEPAIGHSVPRTPAELRELAAIVSRDRIARGSLVSRDGQMVALNVILDGELGRSLDEVIIDVRDATAGEGALVSGVPIFRTEINHRTTAEILRFASLTVVIIAMLLLVVFRDIRAALLPLVAGGSATGVSLGAMGGLGAPLTLSTMILPSTLLALGCALSMHVVAACRRAADDGEMIESIKPVTLPVALSGLTTAIGFVAISTVRIGAIRDVGAFGALGVLVATFASLTLVPAILALTSFGRSRLSGGPVMLSYRKWILRVTTDNRLIIIVATVAILIVSTIGLTRLKLETDATRWFPIGSQVRDDYETIRASLSGISPMNVVISSKRGLNVTSPDFVAKLAEFSAYLQESASIGKVLSLADPLMQLHAGFAGGVGELPNSDEEIQQYLLLLESVSQLEDLLTADRTMANIMIRADDNGSDHLLGLAGEANHWWREHGLPGYEARTTGIMYEFARAEDEIARGQVRGLGFALLAVGLVLHLLFGSVGVAARALAANGAPIAVAFGVMGWLDVPLDAGTVLVGNLALGIAVDDTIHVLVAYREGGVDGRGSKSALEASYGQVLPAITATTIAISLGFAVLTLSDFVFTRNLGGLTASIVVLCYLADIFLLPAMLESPPGVKAAER